VYTALEAVTAVLAALFQRERTGDGQRVEVTMAETMLYVNEHAHDQLWDRDVPEDWVRSFEPATYPVLTTANGESVVISGHPAERGTFDLLLHAGALADRDDDGVPDTLDDCADRANPNQGGCPAADGGAPDGAGPSDGSPETGRADDAGGDLATPRDAALDAVRDAAAPVTDAATDAGPTCAFSGGCGLALGASCTNAAQCASASCVDGVCCNGSCNGTCRACNVAGQLGTCTAQPSGADPDRECRTGFSCNGNGACSLDLGGIPRANGMACTLANECGSAFCKDGVCCNSACNGPCQTCMGGVCKSVTKGDDVPECPAPAQCNAAGRCLAR